MSNIKKTVAVTTIATLVVAVIVAVITFIHREKEIEELYNSMDDNEDEIYEYEDDDDIYEF